MPETVSETRVWPLSVGWQWRTYFDVDTDEYGRPLIGTAETIRGGWAPDRRTAEDRAARARPEVAA